MRKLLLTIWILSVSYTFGQARGVLSTRSSQESSIPEPPKIVELPPIEVISSIITAENSLSQINKEFGDLNYTGSTVYYPPKVFAGVWWNSRAQTTSIFQLPAISEEVLAINEQGFALWLKDIKTPNIMKSSSRRRLIVSHYNLFNNLFFVFHYANQDPASQEIRDKQGFFVRILSDQSYMQMSTSPNFEPDKSMYWRRFPYANIEGFEQVSTNTNTVENPLITTNEQDINAIVDPNTPQETTPNVVTSQVTAEMVITNQITITNMVTATNSTAPNNTTTTQNTDDQYYNYGEYGYNE